MKPSSIKSGVLGWQPVSPGESSPHPWSRSIVGGGGGVSDLGRRGGGSVDCA